MIWILPESFFILNQFFRDNIMDSDAASAMSPVSPIRGLSPASPVGGSSVRGDTAKVFEVSIGNAQKALGHRKM